MSNSADEARLAQETYKRSTGASNTAPISGQSPQNNPENFQAALIRDKAGLLPTIRSLKSTDVILLLTPVVAPLANEQVRADPFEPLGRALAARHSKIRHVPYINRNGITSTHVGFIVRADLIVFVLCRSVHDNGELHLQYAQVARLVGGNRPLIIVVCCEPADLLPLDREFPTVIQSRGYTMAALESTAALMFGELGSGHGKDTPMRDTPDSQGPQPHSWPVEQWDESKDIPSVIALWEQSMGAQFAINASTLAGLLHRPGYARHYVVRDTSSREVLGFCATYLSYVDQAGEKLIASLALLFVRMSHQRQGIGLSLHDHAISQLKRTRGVVRVQLGSTFPRILYGPPLDVHLNEEWLRRRGWQMDDAQPGQGQAIFDLVLDFKDWRPSQNFDTGDDISLRICTQADMRKVLDLVEQESSREDRMGWFDQYSRLVNDVNVKDIIVAVEGTAIIAAALTYTPACGSPVAADLPWAGQIGEDVGGVTCICVPVTRRETLRTRLLDACVHKLKSQGMNKMFLDGICTEANELAQLGFRVWAQYRDVWREAEDSRG